MIHRLHSQHVNAAVFCAREMLAKAMLCYTAREKALTKDRVDRAVACTKVPFEDLVESHADFMLRCMGTVHDAKRIPDSFRAYRNDAVVQLALYLGLEVALGQDGLLYALSSDGCILEFKENE